MNNFRYKLMQFMAGRYGMDGLGYALMALYFLTFIINTFVYSIILVVAGFVFFALMFFRFFSRSVARRRKENEVFMKAFNPVKGFFKKITRRLKDIKTHRYRTCPGCHVTLRLPVKRGTNTVVCPRCGKRVKVRVWI